MSSNASKAESMFREGYNCAQSVLAMCGAQLGMPRDLAIQVAQAFGGGMARTAGTCGAVTGALMLVGLKVSAKDGKDAPAKQESCRLGREFMSRFAAKHGSLTCRDLLGCDISTDEGFRRVHDSGLTQSICPGLVASAAAMVEDVLGVSAPDQARETAHDLVQKAYARIAKKQSSCCGKPASGQASCCEKSAYTVPDHPVPEAELGLSCGNPIAFGHIRKGDVVLDLGSGAGKDVFLAAQKVGEEGKAIGVDMTPEMLKLARSNAVKFFQATGLANVEFREGKIEALPVDAAAVDVVISNCVINLSPDKPQVFREAHRVLKAGGRLLVSDIVLNRPLPPEMKASGDLYAACIAGALVRDEYLAAIRAAGFGKVEILSDRTYRSTQSGDDPVTSGVAHALENVAASITVMAVKG